MRIISGFLKNKKIDYLKSDITRPLRDFVKESIFNLDTPEESYKYVKKYIKDVHEKPMVIRKVNSLMDLINKENLHGVELQIVLNHIIDNIDTTSISEEEREIIGDKIKYVREEK